MNGWLRWAVSHGVPWALVKRGTPKKADALTGQTGWTCPDVSSTSNCELTPWRTNCVDAATAMSGGLQPGPKYEQVVAEDCWPLKLALALLDPAVFTFVLSLRGAAARLDAELRTTVSLPYLFNRGSCRLSLPEAVADA